MMFYGVFPDFVLPPLAKSGWTTGGGQIIAGHFVIKSNGIFLVEASTLSQITAVAIVIEVLEFRRPRYLAVLTLGFLLAYSGTGASILLLSLPLAAVVDRKAHLPVLLVTLFAIGLIATGIIHLSGFTQRIGEFDDPNASGFIRFVSPFWMAADYFGTGSLGELLFGNGPGGVGFIPHGFYAASGDTWFNLLYEYGLLSAFVFTCFFASCFRKSRCPTPLIVGLIYHYLFTGNNLLDAPLVIIFVVLCTLSGPELRVVASTKPANPDRSSLPARRQPDSPEGLPSAE